MFDRIRRRLTLGYVAILALILVLFCGVVVIAFRETSVRQQDRALVKEAELLAGAAAQGLAVGDVPMGSESDDFALVHVGLDGSLIFADPTAPELGLPAAEAAGRVDRDGSALLTTTEGRGGRARVASVAVVEAGEPVGVIQVGRSLRTDLDAVDRLLVVLVPVGLGALALAGVGGLFLSGHAMRPARTAFARQRAFVADASHELKTPLVLIRANAEVHLRGVTDPAQRELIEDLLGETDRMSAVLSDLLLLARLDAAKLPVSRAPFDLSSTLHGAAERFRVRAEAEGKRLDVAVESGLTARGDTGRVEQVLAALLDNALRFTPPGGVVRVVGVSVNGRIVASVADSGPGIPPEHLPRVFDRFYRGDVGRTRAGGGTGLGLTIARDLARSQGGELAAANAEGGGAVFRLELPKG